MTDQRKYPDLDSAVRGMLDEFGDRHQYWILDGHKTVPTTMMEWAMWFETAGDKRIVKQELVGDHYISTVFLGINHNFRSVGPPILFETMVFHKEDWDNRRKRNKEGLPRGLPDIDMERCSTWEQAEEQHERVATLVRMIEE